MPIEPELRPPSRKPTTNGPEPLRRKRLRPAPASGSPQRRKILNIVLGFATAVLLIDAFVGEKGVLAGLRAKRSYEQAEAYLNGLKVQNARLKEDVRRYSDDPGAIEAVAREELGFIRPGEVVFIVRDADPAPR